MRLDFVIDNDVLIKCACYSLLDQLVALPDDSGNVGVLGAARFVVRENLRRRGRVQDRAAALASFEQYLLSVVELEPTEEELSLAARLEEQAVIDGVDLDGGESQLCAIAIMRHSPLVVTGDKRAVQGIEIVQAVITELAGLQGRIACLEQAIAGMISRVGHAAVRSMVCAEPHVDKSLSICFGCRNQSYTEDSVREGLSSYVEDLRGRAPTFLYIENSL